MTQRIADDPATVFAALSGDEAAFSTLSSRWRAPLRAHAYRVVASLSDAEDLVQETFLRAWKGRATYQGRSPFGAWLHGIATNVCLDFLEKRPHRVLSESVGVGEVPWLEPYPDRLDVAAEGAPPDEVVATREGLGLALVVAMQHLPGRQRAVLVLRDALEWSAKETAEHLDTSVASVESALQRARETLREKRLDLDGSGRPRRRPTDAETDDMVRRVVAATERSDVEGLAALMRDDARFSMPPDPEVYVGRETIAASWTAGGFGADWFGQFGCIATRANGMPAVACYVKKPGEATYRAMAVDVLRVEDGALAEITTFNLTCRVAQFGLPSELPA